MWFFAVFFSHHLRFTGLQAVSCCVSSAALNLKASTQTSGTWITSWIPLLGISFGETLAVFFFSTLAHAGYVDGKPGFEFQMASFAGFMLNTARKCSSTRNWARSVVSTDVLEMLGAVRSVYSNQRSKIPSRDRRVVGISLL